MKTLSATFLGLWVALTLMTLPMAQAQVFNGPSDPLNDGLHHAQDNIQGPAKTDIKTAVVTIIGNILDILGIVAVVSLIAAGIWLIAGGGSEDSKNKAKTIILYVLIGLIIVIFARLIVQTLIVTLNTSVQ